jgi:hypothetical protein
MTIFGTQHKNNQNSPDSNLCNPATMVPCISAVILVFDTNHHESKYCKEQEVPQAYAQDSIHLKPFFWWCLIKCIYPCDTTQTYNVVCIYDRELNTLAVHLSYHKFNDSMDRRKKYLEVHIMQQQQNHLV